MNHEACFSIILQFLNSIGLSHIDWQGKGLTLNFADGKRLFLEVVDDGLLFSLSRTITVIETRPILIAALTATHYQKGLPWPTQVGLLGEKELVLTLFYKAGDLSLPSLNNGMDLLEHLHHKIGSGH